MPSNFGNQEAPSSQVPMAIVEVTNVPTDTQ
jgi:hypothetical protein